MTGWKLLDSKEDYYIAGIGVLANVVWAVFVFDVLENY